MFRQSSTEQRKVGGSIPPLGRDSRVGPPAPVRVAPVAVTGRIRCIRSGLDIVPNEELAVAGRIDDEHPPHPRVQEEVAMTQIKGTNLEA
jgi:hypothetical protein